MGEANEGKSSRMERLSLHMDTYPRDLLQRLMATNTQLSESDAHKEQGESSGEIELNLGLSMGGRFGVDKNANKLIRSSSIAGSIPLPRDDDAATLRSVSYPTLIRASSLPTETEEEWRKRKELQTLRRMEAKRRRTEKQKNSNSNSNMNIKLEKDGCLEEERRETEGNLREKLYNIASDRLGSSVMPPFGLSSWAAAARQPVFGGGINMATEKGKGSLLRGNSGSQGFGLQPNSQGSVESQGGCSSGTSEFESKPLQGSSSAGEVRSPSSNQSLPERSNQEATGSSGTKTNENTLSTSASKTNENTTSTSGSVENASKKSNYTENRGKGSGMNALEDMPCVFTKGDGPNGRRVDGILYRYGKGEEVRIMCVCHGSFLSPAEFVKHAGGGDVAHPLRHIVVNPSSNSLV